jgi:anti-sigma B factor antagonist
MENSVVCAAADDGAAVVTVRGEVDFSNHDEVAAGIRDAIAALRPTVVFVDLKEATFVDSTGLGALIEGYHAAGDQECRFVVVNPTENFRRVLSVTGLSELFGLTEIGDVSMGDFRPTEATGA